MIDILPQEKIRAKVIAFVKGEYKRKPSEPKFWSTSMRSVAVVLSDSNWAQVKVIRETDPHSMVNMAQSSGGQPSNLLQTHENHGTLWPGDAAT